MGVATRLFGGDRVSTGAPQDRKRRGEPIQVGTSLKDRKEGASNHRTPPPSSLAVTPHKQLRSRAVESYDCCALLGLANPTSGQSSESARLPPARKSSRDNAIP